MHAMNAITVLDVFCSCYSDFQLLAKHSSAALLCKQLLTSACTRVNDSSVHYVPTHLIKRVTCAMKCQSIVK